MKPPIRLTGVRQNNLKNLRVEFPTRQFTVVTGLSGSGKSSLAFDTLYAEGQRRYVESLSTYTRQFLEKMPKPDLDQVENIPPAIALEQRNSVMNSRSTVGTQTEIVDYLRVLYAKLGITECLSCQGRVDRLDAEKIFELVMDRFQGKKILILAPIEARTTSDSLDSVNIGGSGKPKKKKKAPTKKEGLLQAQALMEIIREQGFKRIYLESRLESEVESGKTEAAGTLLHLDDDEEAARLALQGVSKSSGTSVWVVVDRLALPKFTAELTVEKIRNSKEPEHRDLVSRMGDSLRQAFQAGQNRVGIAIMGEPGVVRFSLDYACTVCGRTHRVPEPLMFSFNSPVGACPSCSGFGFNLELDESLVVPDSTKTIKNGAIDPFTKPSFSDWQADLFRFAERQGISIGRRYRDLLPSERNLLWEGSPDDKTFPGIRACFEELKKWKYKLYIRVFIRRYQSQSICTLCSGTRLTAEARAVKLGGKSMPDVLNLPVTDARIWLRELRLSPSEATVAREILTQVGRRLEFLDEVGVGYLTLSRLARSLSGGESQRINLATQLGNGLCGTLYVLDEPSIGLHAADTDRLIGVLKRLRDQGNTVVVVEHDLEVMKNADHLIELGPGAGARGGDLIAAGSPSRLEVEPGSLTGKYLSGVFNLVSKVPPRGPGSKFLKITGCRENNLKNLTVEFPLERFVVVSGMSGSGKSTLIHKTLHAALARLFQGDTATPGKFDRLYGADQLSGVVLLDQSPIGKSSRSNPATYLKAWDEVRRIYASQSLAMRRGYTTQYFSFNVDGGRCTICKGEGEVTIDMHFMAEIKLPCEECEGRRFKKNVLEVSYRGKNVAELLTTTIEEAYDLFVDYSQLRRKLGLLKEVGLGYLQLGQSGTTLSGGEAQRLKIAATLEEQNRRNLLYIFDEPTTGLHLEDIKRLMEVIQGLVDSRNSVVMIEHHLDVIAQADWLIDLGPGGGEAGGDLVAEGLPMDLMNHPASVTGKMLRKVRGHAEEIKI